MGLLTNLFTGKLPIINAPGVSGFSSPLVNVPSTIHELVYSEYFQGEIAETTRQAAMQVPAISRARSILVGIIAGMPLRSYDAEGNETTPEWMQSTSGPTSVWHRMAWTIDDILFYGGSLWSVKRDGDNKIVDAARVPRAQWRIDEDSSEILVDDKPVAAASVLYFPGSDEGLLSKGAPTIRGARAIERAWIGRAQNPIPLIELHNVGDDELEDDEIEDLVSTWGAARTAATGAVGYTDSRVEVRVHGTVQTDMYLEARNAAVLDAARHTNMPAALLDGSMSTATLTYSTTEGKSNEFWDYSIPIYTAPIEARLSQDDVVPAGEYTRLDRTAAVRLPQPVTSPPTDD